MKTTFEKMIESFQKYSVMVGEKFGANANVKCPVAIVTMKRDEDEIKVGISSKNIKAGNSGKIVGLNIATGEIVYIEDILKTAEGENLYDITVEIPEESVELMKQIKNMEPFDTYKENMEMKSINAMKALISELTDESIPDEDVNAVIAIIASMISAQGSPIRDKICCPTHACDSTTFVLKPCYEIPGCCNKANCPYKTFLV